MKLDCGAGYDLHNTGPVHVIMFLRVGMKVLVEKFAVTVHVPVDEVGSHQ